MTHNDQSQSMVKITSLELALNFLRPSTATALPEPPRWPRPCGLPTAQPSCSASTLTQPQSPQHFAHPTAFRAIIRRLSAAMPPIMLWSVKLTSFWARCQDKGGRGQGNEIGKTEYFSTWLVMT